MTMTPEELKRLPWRMQSHLNMEHEHACTYKAEIGGEPIWMCVHAPVKEDYTYGRAYAHYQWRGKVYKSEKKLLEAINNK